MAFFNFSKIRANNNDVKQDIKQGDGCSWKIWQIIVGLATIIATIIAIITFINQ